MADLRALVVAALALVGGAAQAGYAYPADPSGFVRSGSWGSGYGYATGANDSWYGRVVHQPNGLRVPVPGKTVTMPVSYRLAANAPRVAAGVLFSHPALRAALGIASWLGAASIFWDEVNKRWYQVGNGEVSTGYEYQAHDGSWHSTPEAACRASVTSILAQPIYAGKTTFKSYEVSEKDGITSCRIDFFHKDWGNDHAGFVMQKRGSSCPVGWYITPAGCSQTPPPDFLGQEEFVEELAPLTMPQTVPRELPYPTPLPVEPTPGPWINPEPGPNPSHRPRFVPLGEPLTNPQYDPSAEPSPQNQPYIRPGIRLNPSPAPGEPWRMDLEPVNRPTNNNDPSQGEENEPGENDKPKPEDQQSLCEKHPDIVACQKLGTLTPTPLKQSTVPLAINREEGFGPADGMCPAPKEFIIMGKQMAFRWDLLCDFASGIRPILIGFAYLSAVLAFMGLTRRGD